MCAWISGGKAEALGDARGSVGRYSRRERDQDLAHPQILFPARLEKIAAAPKEGHFWQADHIQAVCEGGGECDLDNYRTLCTPCHMKVTGMLAPGARDIKKRKRQMKKKTLESGD